MSDVEIESFRSAAWRQIQRAGRELGHGNLRGLVEALLFASPEPLSLRELTRLTRAPRGVIGEILDELGAEYAGRGMQVVQVAGGHTFLTNPLFAAAVREVTGRRAVRMTRAQLETVAIVAYRQPITRPEIDDVRGVDSGPVLRTLLERELVRVLGKKEEPGRPLLYGTTDAFLKIFGLPSLAALPTLREFTELSDESQATYERKLGERVPRGDIVFDDEPDAPPALDALDDEEAPPDTETPGGVEIADDDTDFDEDDTDFDEDDPAARDGEP